MGPKIGLIDPSPLTVIQYSPYVLAKQCKSVLYVLFILFVKFGFEDELLFEPCHKKT